MKWADKQTAELTNRYPEAISLLNNHDTEECASVELLRQERSLWDFRIQLTQSWHFASTKTRAVSVTPRNVLTNRQRFCFEKLLVNGKIAYCRFRGELNTGNRWQNVLATGHRVVLLFPFFFFLNVCHAPVKSSMKLQKSCLGGLGGCGDNILKHFLFTLWLVNDSKSAVTWSLFGLLECLHNAFTVVGFYWGMGVDAIYNGGWNILWSIFFRKKQNLICTPQCWMKIIWHCLTASFVQYYLNLLFSAFLYVNWCMNGVYLNKSG